MPESNHQRLLLLYSRSFAGIKGNLAVEQPNS
jgi:hypothetical protein